MRLFSFLPLVLCFVVLGSALTPTAMVENGVLTGTTTSLPSATVIINKFLGVPYAQSPPKRFEPPQAVSASNETIQATAWKSACYQQFSGSKEISASTQKIFNNPAPRESEDCLYLNVYAPAPNNTTRVANSTIGGRAVLFWIYGGAFQFGTGSLPGYDGSHFAAFEDVIVVTHNYRTNIFGFPSSPEIPLTGHNLGLLDQRLALTWVQNNIASFGGDPSKVTIFGESAGAFSVDALVTSYGPNSTTPFRAAIMESGQASEFPSFNRSLLQNGVLQEGWFNLTAELNCPGNFSSNLTCVKAAEATDIKAVIEKNSLFFSPWADNITFVSNPAERRASGEIAMVPVLEGTNADEAHISFATRSNKTLSSSGLGGASSLGDLSSTNASVSPSSLPSLSDIFRLQAGLLETQANLIDLANAYPLGSPGLRSPEDVVAKIATEAAFQCPQARHANASASAGIPTYRYLYNATFPSSPFGAAGRACHASEIPEVFSTYSPINATSQQVGLSSFMRGAWARFAKDPENGSGWVAVGKGTGEYDLGVLGDVGNDAGAGVTVVDRGVVDKNCELLEKLAVRLRDEARQV